MAVATALTCGAPGTISFGCAANDSGTDYPVVPLAAIASSDAPYSANEAIALVSEDVACTIESFEKRVVCGSRAGNVVGVFGKEGDGPGEFQSPSGLLTGRDGTIRVFDSSRSRMYLFRVTGELLSETATPLMFIPQAATSAIFGVRANFPRESASVVIPAALDPATGEVVWERRGSDEWVPEECRGVSLGVPTEAGGHVYAACGQDLVFFGDRDSDQFVVTRSPSYVERTHDQRDVDEYLRFLASTTTANRSVAPEALAPHADAYRAMPKRWFLRSRPLEYDAWGRLWAATTLGRDSFSYFDLWVDTTHVGMVRIRDRLLGFDLLGSTLATLVERKPGPSGIAELAVDWYDIGSLDLGR